MHKRAKTAELQPLGRVSGRLIGEALAGTCSCSGRCDGTPARRRPALDSGAHDQPFVAAALGKAQGSRLRLAPLVSPRAHPVRTLAGADPGPGPQDGRGGRIFGSAWSGSGQFRPRGSTLRRHRARGLSSRRWDMRQSKFRHRADLTRGFLPVHPGHRDVGKHDVGAELAELLHRVLTVVREEEVDVEPDSILAKTSWLVLLSSAARSRSRAGTGARAGSRTRRGRPPRRAGRGPPAARADAGAGPGGAGCEARPGSWQAGSEVTGQEDRERRARLVKRRAKRLQLTLSPPGSETTRISPRPTGSLREVGAVLHRDDRQAQRDELACGELPAAFVGVDQEGALDPVGDAALAAFGLRHGELEAEAEAGALAKLAESTQISPSMSSIRLLVIARPRPVPSKLRFISSSTWLNSPKMWRRMSGAMPIPVSSMETVTWR